MADITETGPVGLEGLKGLNQQYNKQEEPIGRIENYSPPSAEDLLRVSLYDPTERTINTGQDFGSSKYDSEDISSDDIEDLENYRAHRQSAIAKLGLGLAKGAVLAGTTFIDGTVGTLWGIGTAIHRGDISGLWDNDVSNGLNKLIEASEEAMPVYYTRDERENPLALRNLLSSSTLGDKLIKNFGFTVGALYGGGLTSKGIKALGKGVMAASRKAGATIGTMKKISNTSSIVAGAMGTVVSSLGEARMEGLNNANETTRPQVEELNNIMQSVTDLIKVEYEANKGKELVQVESDGKLQWVDPAALKYDQDMAKAKSLYDKEMARIEELRRRIGTSTMAWNIPILLGSYTFQFGKLLANGFNTAKRAYNISTKAMDNTLQFTAGTTKAKGILKGLGNMISEGGEELSQSVVSSASAYKSASDVDQFYKAKTDPDAEEETLSWIKAFGMGINETLNDDDALVGGIIGGVTGGIGMPIFRTRRNAEGKRRLSVSMQEGLYGAIRDNNQLMREEQALVDAMNSRVQSPEFKNYYQGLIRHNKYQNDMNLAAQMDDKFEFKNAEHSQLVSDIIMFDKAGKLSDLTTLINATFDTSDENLASIVENTTSTAPDGTRVGPFVDSSGNPMFSTPEGKEQMIKKLTENRDEFQKTIDNYVKIKNELETDYGDRFTDEQLEELTWMKSMIGNWEDRVVSVEQDLRETLKNNENFTTIVPQLQSLEDGTPIQANIIDLDGNVHPLNKTISQKDPDLVFFSDLLDLALGKKSIGEVLISYENMGGIIDMLKSVAPYAPMYGISPQDFRQINDVIQDVFNMISTKMIYESKLQEYLTNPQSMQEAQTKADKETVEKKVQKEKQKTTDDIDNSSTAEVVEKIESSEVNPDEFGLDDDDLEFLNGGKPDATEEEQAKANRNQKVQNAKKIVQTKQRVSQLVPTKTTDKQAAEDAQTLVNNAATVVESDEELKDLEAEIYNDPDILPLTPEEEETLKELQEEGVDPEELANLAKEAKQARLDKAKAILHEIYEQTDEESVENDGLPKPSGEEVVVKEFTLNDSKDPVDTPEPVNNNTVEEIKEEPEEPEDPTPDTSNIPLDEDAPEADKSAVKGYWKSNTTEYPIHRDKTNNDPYYLKANPQKRPLYKAIYDFLKSRGVFARLNNSVVQPGQRVRFAFSKELQQTIKKETGESTPVLLLINDRGEIIGDMSNPKDRYVYDNFKGLNDLYQAAMNYAREHSGEIEGDLVIIPGIETTVNSIFVGRPLFSPNTSSDSRKTLNTIANGKKFKLGIALTSSPDAKMIMTPGKKRKDGLSQEDRTIMSPRSAKAGQPYLLIETSDPRRKYLPVSIVMPTFGINSNGTTLYNLVVEHLEKLKRLSVDGTNEQLTKWKDELKELLAIDDVYVDMQEITTLPLEGPAVKSKNFRLRVKVNKTDTAWTTIHEGPIMDTTPIVSALEQLNVPFQVSRKFINSTYHGKDYNSMVGELAETNLEVGALHTVNDFFTLNPIINNQRVEAERPRGIDTHVEAQVEAEQNKGEVSRETALIVIKESKVFNTPKRKAILSKLSDETLSALSQISPEDLRQTITELETSITPSMAKEEVDRRVYEAIKDLVPSTDSSDTTRNRLTEEETESTEALTRKELRRIAKILPQLTQDEKVVLLDAIIRTPNGKAWGQFRNGIIYLYKKAAKGTAYHESFHFVFNTLLSKSEVEQAFKQAEAIWGKKDPIALEEDMAEDFRKYMQDEETFTGRLRHFWAKIKNMINKLRGKENYLENLYFNIAKGKLAKRKAQEFTGSRNYTIEEVQASADSRVNNDRISPTLSSLKDNWGRFVDSWIKRGYDVRGKYNPKRGKYIITSITARPKNRLVNDRTPIKPEYTGKLIFAQSGTGKTTIADNSTVIDSDYILADILGTSVESAGIAYQSLDMKAKISISNLLHRRIRAALEEGKTVLTSSPSMISNADVIVYNQSIEQANARTNEDNRVGGNRFISSAYQEAVLQQIADLNNPNQEKISLNNSTYLGDVLLSDSSYKVPRNTYRADSIEEATSNFLKSFGFTVNHLESYENDVPLFDALYRVINVHNPEEITDGIGYAVAYMMQYTPEFMELAGLIHAPTKSIKRALLKHDNAKFSINSRQFKSSDKQYYIEEVGKEIARELRKFYNKEQVVEKEGVLSKIWKLIESFFELLSPKNKEYVTRLHSYTTNMADAVIRNDPSYIRRANIKPGDTVPSTKVDLDKALKENPYERNILERLSKYEVSITGSAALSVQGEVYRNEENPLHDLDFNTPSTYTKESIESTLDKEFPNYANTNVIPNDSYTTYTYLILDRPFEIRKETPNSAISFIYDKSTGKKLGSFVYSELELEEGIKGKFLDFFVGEKNNTEGITNVEVGGIKLAVTKSSAPMRAKLQYGRPKDIYDYSRFIPKSSSTEEIRQYNTIRLAYSNLTQEQREYIDSRISKEEYDKMTLKEKEVLFRCMY